MSLKAYEEACIRAELFGEPKPEKQEFLEKHKHLDVVEFEEVDIKTAEYIEMLNEDLKQASGGLTELNTILATTQTKINKLKGVCGSLTNFFRVKLAKGDLSYSSEQSYVGQTNYDSAPQADGPSGINEGLGPNDKVMSPNLEQADINTALDDLEAIKVNEETTVLSSAMKDVGNKMSSQMSKLDQMLFQADRAQSSLQNQNKQLRGFLR